MGDEPMKRQHLNKMSTLLETLEIVSKNAKNKGHRSGFRCYELAKQIADQFDVFVPTLDSIITNKENKNNPTLIKGNKPMTKSEYNIYQVIRKNDYIKMVDVFADNDIEMSIHTVRQYVHLLRQKGFIQSVNVKGKHFKLYKAGPINFNTMDRNLVNKLSV